MKGYSIQRKADSGFREGFLLFLWILFRIVLFPSSILADIAPAGEVISSVSIATYEANGTPHVAVSNEVYVSVLPLFGPVLVPDGTPDAPGGIERAFSGETVSFPFRLINTGNADDTFDLSITFRNPSDFIPTSTVVYLDADRDSLIDPGEVIVTDVGPLTSGEEVSLILAADLPLGLIGGEVSHVDLVARSLSDTSVSDEGNVVRIVARDEAQVALTKVADTTFVLPGDEITFTVSFVNPGERAAANVVLTDHIDYAGNCTGTEYVSGSVSASPPGRIEYFDVESSQWVDVAPPQERVKGIRLNLLSLPPDTPGSISFGVRVLTSHLAGEILNIAVVDFTGGDGQPYHLNSNEVSVIVGPVSSLAIGPRGNPTAETGSADDRVVITLNGSDTTYTFWHEVLNSGNFTDTVRVVLADSAAIPVDWNVQYVDSTGAPLLSTSPSIALLGALARGETSVVGLRVRSSLEGFRRFSGRDLSFNVEAQSLVDVDSRDSVEDVMVKTDLPLLAVTQSIREPTALIGDLLSYIVTVENITEETTLDSVVLVDNISPGLEFAGGSDRPVIEGNILRWALGRLQPGERREVVFRARVKAGQEWGRLVSTAWASGVTELGEWATDGPAVASVLIVEGIFTRRGIVFGGVFEDTNGDGIWSEGERGISGISVYLEDGTYAVSDSTGRFSIPGVVEGAHVVRLDPSTLLDSLVTGRGSYFGLGVAGEMLVDLPPSGNRRVDFPLVRPPPPPPGDESKEREGNAPEFTGVGRSGFPREGRPHTTLESENASAEDHMYEALTIPSTHFAPGSAHLKEIPLSQIAVLTLWIREHPGWKIFISGHTDSIPISSAEYPSNFVLSLARARTVFQMLRMSGIPEESIDYMGYGDRMPVASNATPDGRALNRRVEIKVFPPEGSNADDPGLPEIINVEDTLSYSLADESGICAEIVKPEEGHVYYIRDEIEVEVASPLHSSVELYVNNVPVGIEKIGQKKIDVRNRMIGYTFYSVKIKEGKNDILVVCKEHGGKRYTCIRHVYLAGRPAGIVPEHEKVIVQADGKTSPELVFLVKDSHDLPVRDGVFVTVGGPSDLIDDLDANPHQTGVQVCTRNGQVTLKLPPSRESRREKIRVSCDGMTSVSRLEYTSVLRDWFLFGYGEGEIGLENLTGSGSTHRSIERYHDGFFAEGKLAFYGQGEIRDGNLLTCAIDTRPLREDRLFRRIEPEKYYPIYGDASELKFNTASKSGTYIRLDNRRYSAMLGDFRTELGSTEFTRYHRSFNGLEGEVRFDRGAVKTFITRTDQVTYQEEIPAEGTSGFYFLQHYPLIENSEKVRIEVRDRYRPEKILRVDYKQINRDYDINYMDGSILFKEPVPAMDENLNPVTIVVSYECTNAAEQNFIYGLRTSIDVKDSLAVGVTAVLEEEGVENSSLVGFDVSGVIRSHLAVEGEYAHSEKFLLGSANAFRIKIGGRSSEALRWGAYYREIDDNFFNPSFSGGKTELGSTKFGGDLDWKINRAFSVSAKGYRHSLRERSESKDYADLLTHYRTGVLHGRAGVASTSHSDTREGDHSSVLVLTAIGFERGKTRGEVEWDQIVSGEEVQEYPNRIQASLSRSLWKYVRAALKHEYRTGSRTGTRHLTQLGLESRVTEDLHLFSRYRLEGAMSGERGQATIGLKNRFRISDDLTATFSAEKLATVSGRRTDDFLALSTGALYTPPWKDYRLKGDYEIRLESDRRKHLAGIAALKRMGEKWSALVKGDLWFSDEKREANHSKGSSTVGLSLRPRRSRSLTLLSLLKTTYEKNSPAHPKAVDNVLEASLEANYIVNPCWELEGKVASRWVRNTFKSYTASASSFLYQAQVIRIIGERWDIGLRGRLVHQRETHTFRYGGGCELGRLLAENVWLGVGYDFGGHEDRDTSVNSFGTSGFHIRLRLKFNEKLMEYFSGAGEGGG